MSFPAIFTLILAMVISMPSHARDTKPCDITDKTCLYDRLQGDIEQISQSRWRNSAYRDLAESLAYDMQIDRAIALVEKIDNADTKAMTIRAIGMVLAIHRDLTIKEYQSIFEKLNEVAESISDLGARDIAYTYIAMAQAFAGLDADATLTADAMRNPALKHKAFGETAEIQAEKGKFEEAIKSIEAIDSIAFKNKALGIVSDIFVKKGDLESALKVAHKITNQTKKTTAMQKIINHQIGMDKLDD